VSFLADRTNGRAYATVFRLSVCRLYRYALGLNSAFYRKSYYLTAYMKSYMRNRLVPKWMTLTFVYTVDRIKVKSTT